MAIDFVFLKNITDETKTLRHQIFNQASYVSVAPIGIVKTVGVNLRLSPGEAAKIPYAVFNDNMRNKSFERISEDEFDALFTPNTEVDCRATKFVCSKCGKECASKAGLAAHERSCNS